MFYFEPKEVDVESGETVTIDLVASSHGAYGDGVGELSATIAYDPDVFTVTDVEHGPMLAADDGDAAVDGAVEIDDDAGTVTIEQKRTPAGDGATATETAATITLEVAADAEPTTETLEVRDAEMRLVSDAQQSTIEHDGTVHVDGGGESGGDGDDGPDGVTLANEGESDDGAESGDETESNEATDDASGEDSSDDSVPGFTVPSVLVGIGALLWFRSLR
uniref:Cohesin domain-containing protein n=2 Tax=Haloterrigena alkaliphila TaxID=2816475 RepID=A0A8A2VLD5_9EURY